MGLFSSNRNYHNDTSPDQNNVNSQVYDDGGSQFGNYGNTTNDGRPSFSSYDQANNYGNSNVDTSTTGGHGIFGRDHNTGLISQNNNINTTGGIINHDRTTRPPIKNTNITGNHGHFQHTDGGALGQNANMDMNGRQGLSHHDRNTALVEPSANVNANNIGQQGTSGYTGTSAYSNVGTGRGRWFSRRRNQDYDTSAHSKTGAGATAGGGWFSRNHGTGVMNFHRRSRFLSNRHQREKFDINSGRYNRRPTFGQWLRFTWLDIVTMVVLGAVALGVNRAGPAPNRSFPVFFQDGEIVYPQFAYPLRNEIIPLWLSAFLASMIPIFVILFMQFRIRSFWDVNNAIIGLLYSLITAAVFQVFLKWLIGGLRPHFLTVCQPIIDNKGAELGNGLKQIYYDRSICSGDPDSIDESLESFPSGHATAAFAGFIFLFLYLNAKLKVFSNHHAAMWKLIATYAPVLGATLIAATLTIDEYNNWYDVVVGAIIGTIMAFSTYRMVYASVLDFRFNHIPLTRHTPFSYGAGEAGAGGFETAAFTHASGWGFEEAYGGAPFDAAHNLRGAVAGFNHGVHDQNYGQNRSNISRTTNGLKTGQHGTGGAGITGHGRHDQTEKTGIVGQHTNTTHPHPNNVDRNNANIVDAGNRSSVIEPNIQTRGGRFHQSNKSLERRPVGGGRGAQGVDQMV